MTNYWVHFEVFLKNRFQKAFFWQWCAVGDDANISGTNLPIAQLLFCYCYVVLMMLETHRQSKKQTIHPHLDLI